MALWQLGMGAALLVASTALYYLQVIVFQNLHDTLFYLMQDLAFLPVQVLLITLLLNHLLGLREKRVLLKKLNMLIGVFFSEVGTELAKICFAFDGRAGEMKKMLHVNPHWDREAFAAATKQVREHRYQIDARQGDLEKLKEHLVSKRDFLMSLLANPNIMEHDAFTELMWAVFHLTDELGHRTRTDQLPDADYAHLSGDIQRVSRLLLTEWLVYMSHLQKDYPHLFFPGRAD